MTDAVLEQHLASFEPPAPQEAALVVVPGEDSGQLLARVRSALAVRVK